MSQVLTKSLLPLPDKWHGLTDVEKRYRCGLCHAFAPSTGASSAHATARVGVACLTVAVAAAVCGRRQRYLDMIVTEETRATLRARSRIVSTIRRQLEDRDFLEVRPSALATPAHVPSSFLAKPRCIHACSRCW